jgi:hypothetical protein
MEKFKQGKVAVNCRTEEAAKKFLQECENEGLRWTFGGIATNSTAWNRYKEKTCFDCCSKQLKYCHDTHYKVLNYEIIKYKEETKLKILCLVVFKISIL